MSAFGGKADIAPVMTFRPLLTQSGHRADRNVAAQQSPTVAEVCYPFCRKHGRHRSVKRREFITLLGGAAAWPLAARAQQPGRMRRIGVLAPIYAEELESKARISAFVLRLRELGWVDGSNVQIVYRWSGGKVADTRKYAAELAAQAPDVLRALHTLPAGPSPHRKPSPLSLVGNLQPPHRTAAGTNI